MRLAEVDFGGGTPVDAYGPGFFRLGETVIDGPLLILPGAVRASTHPTGWIDVDAILAAAGALDVLFVGMGAEIAALDGDVRAQLEVAQIGVEVMATPSACRTYNVLLSEGRRVGLVARPI